MRDNAKDFAERIYQKFGDKSFLVVEEILEFSQRNSNQESNFEKIFLEDVLQVISDDYPLGEVYTYTNERDIQLSKEKILAGAKMLPINGGKDLVVAPDHIEGLPKNEVPIYNLSALKEHITKVRTPIWDLNIAQETGCYLETDKIKDILEGND